MSRPADQPRSPVTPDDLDEIVALAVAALGEVPEAAWDGRAGTLEWDCWETVEHIADDLFAYAAQLGPRKPPLTSYVPFEAERRHSGGPANTIRADKAAGVAGLLQVLESCGGLMSAIARSVPPQARGFHPDGVSDAEGFTAMSIVETAVHMHDLATGLGLRWQPPAGPCARVLARLFPGAPADTDPWDTLLWATGRGELPGRPRLTQWRWYGEPPA
jgi:hypothetical protein